MKKFLLQVSGTSIGNSVLKHISDFAYLLESKEDGILRVLTYHRVDYPNSRPWLYPGLISATPEEFEKQMKLLKQKYYLVTGSELVRAISGGSKEKLPQKSVLVTFDDAYLDFRENAWPIMKSLDIPVILFVATAYPNNPTAAFWWDELYQALSIAKPSVGLVLPDGKVSVGDGGQRTAVYKRIRDYFKKLAHQDGLEYLQQIYAQLGFVKTHQNSVMSWGDLRSVSLEGVTIGAHSQTHPMLNRIPLKTARAEIRGSAADIKRELGFDPLFFAYPSGGVNETVSDLMFDEGFTAAFTTESGISRVGRANPFQLKRINMTRATTSEGLPLRLLSSLYSTRSCL